MSTVHKSLIIKLSVIEKCSFYSLIFKTSKNNLKAVRILFSVFISFIIFIRSSETIYLNF